jgi:hypothetical protein
MPIIEIVERRGQHSLGLRHVQREHAIDDVVGAGLVQRVVIAWLDRWAKGPHHHA